MSRLEALTRAYFNREGEGGDFLSINDLADLAELQYDRIKRLEAEVARIEPVVVAAREWRAWRARTDLPCYAPAIKLANAFDAAEEADQS